MHKDGHILLNRYGQREDVRHLIERVNVDMKGTERGLAKPELGGRIGGNTDAVNVKWQ